jgi:REP element-mobilizing transposase RayT
MLRGVNSQTIFEDEEDNLKFLECLGACKEISGFVLYAYCLMGNHIHLLLEERREKLATIFERINTRYAVWFNRKYGRVGYLFQSRFKSEPVDDDLYFFTLLRYIYNNPVKAGLAKTPQEYYWSSRSLLGFKSDLIDHERLFKKITPAALLEFLSQKPDDNERFLEPEDRKRAIPSDREVSELIKQLTGLRGAVQLQNLPREIQDDILKKLKIENAGVRQLSRITGINKNRISTLLNDSKYL